MTPDHSEAEERRFEKWYEDRVNEPDLKGYYKCAWKAQDAHYQPEVERLTKEVEELKVRLFEALEVNRELKADLKREISNGLNSLRFCKSLQYDLDKLRSTSDTVSADKNATTPKIT